MKLDFKPQPYVGIDNLIPNVTPEARQVILKMLIYNADQRFTAAQLLRHNLFKELREFETA